MKNEQSRAPQQEYDAPHLQRRSTYPHPSQAQRYIEVERTDRIRYPDDYANDPRKYPPISGSKYAPSGARSRAMEDLDDSDRRSHYTTGSKARRRSEVSTSRKPLLLADAEHRSVAGSKHTASGPKLLMDHAYRSDAGSGTEIGADPAYLSVAPSRRSAAPSVDGLFKPVDYHSRAPSHAGTKVSAAPSRHTAASSRRSSVSRRHERDDDDHRSYTTARAPRPAEVETFVSARGDRSSASTVRPAQPRTMYTGEHGVTADMNVGNLLAAEFSRSRKAPPSSRVDGGTSRDDRSRVSAATAIKVPVRSRAPSHATLREAPLPGSYMDDARSEWEVWEDDGKRVAPDDSISCIGRSRRSRR
ncbi:uncharacterized protein B0I36DRAFT_325660 [Microdochium trichocladiopsis]|uniref:Uncharacterized protein n=1 Tax=Microdochium trichocladiopsis TaxID=1682393 RepID=A0A9P9BPM5_9PEZI|nr:uncharacterized protein B0I36DRAFT_325660 [Microdochium trichocladiopsis]KAH7029382.1 hypothetical protein B0I36DRAFT_325660 [Microdochium trichocladiopsis]